MVIGARAAFFRMPARQLRRRGAEQVGDGGGIREKRRVVAVEAVRGTARAAIASCAATGIALSRSQIT